MNQNTYHTIYTGTKQVTTSAAQLTTDDIPIKRSVTLLASSGNVGSIYYGNSGVAATGANEGFPLKANLGKEVKIDNVNKIYIVGQNSTDRVHWEAV